MPTIIEELNQSQKKKHLVDVKSGDTVKAHQQIKEGNKERVQIFQGLVIRTDRMNSHLSRITVRRIASGVGVEKSFLLNSPLVMKVEITKRSKVRRNYLTYMRERTGKAARLSGLDFNRQEVNNISEDENQPVQEKKDNTEKQKESKPEASKTS